MAAQKRATQLSALKRAVAFTESAEFAAADIDDIETRLGRLDSIWDAFTEEHATVTEQTLERDAAAARLNEGIMEEAENVYLRCKAALARRKRELNAEAEGARLAAARAAKTANRPSSNRPAERAESTTGTSSATAPGSARSAEADGIDNAYDSDAESEAEGSRFSLDSRPDMRITMPNRSRTGLQLQPTDIPKFNGTYSDWPAFRDLYLPLVHSDASLLPIAKLNVLINHLQGPALDLIAGIQISNANYEVAWDLVSSTYENTRLITNSLLRILRELVPLDVENPAGLRYIVIKFRQVCRQLASNGSNIDEMKDSLMFDLTELLDPSTRNHLEGKQLKRQHNGADEMNLDEVLEWLETRARSTIYVPTHEVTSKRPRFDRVTAVSGAAQSRNPFRSAPSSTASANPFRSAPSSTQDGCPMCKANHSLDVCEKFIALHPYTRSMRVKSFKACFNCFSSQHTVNECPKPVCRYCTANKKHHRLLCFVHCGGENPTVAFMRLNGMLPSPAMHPMLLHEDSITTDQAFGDELLATALVNVTALNGHQLTARLLCDSGAQSNVISETFLQKLRLPRLNTATAIDVIGNVSPTPARGMVRLHLTARSSTETNYQIEINALVMKKVASILPSAPVDIGDWPSKVVHNLADPTLKSPGSIDLLVGSHVWSRIIQPDIVRSTSNNLIAQLSQFGWLIYGGLETLHQRTLLANVCTQNAGLTELNENMQRLFRLEEVSEQKHRSAEETLCEKLFMDSVSRDESGRYVAPLPLKPDALQLGNSRRHAYQRYMQLEQKFERNPEFHAQYVNFMQDYIEQGHMSLIPRRRAIPDNHYYIPHHGIDNGKFRVVFDGSAVTSSGQSLNDILLLGERLQDNLSDIILRFCCHRIALTADIRQMYRQILVPTAQRCFQQVFWRVPGDQHIGEYQLNTVTYGLKHAPHTAVRTLHKCAEDAAAAFPVAAAIAKRDFYMDDLTTGGDSPEEVIEIRKQMADMLASAGFELAKWASNDWTVINSIGDAASSPQSVELRVDDVRSVLGVVWNPVRDVFQFITSGRDDSVQPTKRRVTSEMAKLFDPTGLLAPLITRGKGIIRTLWMSKIGWDEELTGPLRTLWQAFYKTIHRLEDIQVPRWIGTGRASSLELHAFGDASEVAYAAAIYYRVTAEDGSVACGLLASKTKVAPLKTQSVPRLELCAALETARLTTSLMRAYANQIAKITYWSDSTIVLAWLSKSPHQLKTFVANRIAEIQTSSDGGNWRHVPSTDNPADIASRGLDAPELVDAQLWWHGPSWLKLSDSEWPAAPAVPSEAEEGIIAAENKPITIAAVAIKSFWLAADHSDFWKLCLVTARVLRFVRNAQAAVARRKNGEPKRQPTIKITPLPCVRRRDWIEAESFWLRQIQQIGFASELRMLEQEGAKLPRSSRLLGLSPFLDERGLIRVGGRLTNAPIPYNSKHPIVLPGESPLVKYIIDGVHKQQGHGGAQLTSQVLRDKFWIIGGRNSVRSVIHRCVVCRSHQAETAQQQMVPLVAARVTASRPFTHVSIDYCGPFAVKRYPGRCQTMVNVHVAVFICMATRAIHLQVVNDQSTAAFIDAYQQFAARRGHCESITSDNAKYFVGAKRKLDAVLQTFVDSATHKEFATRGIEWKFIMPMSPSQGGSHEIAVKLYKHHLYRIMGHHKLSVPEFTSLTTRIEACLNSRPLGVLHEDPSDLPVLTPAHFLIHGPFENVAVDAPCDERQSLASHWRRLQFLHQYFWSRWQSDYVNSLANRTKWKIAKDNVRVGDIVLVKDKMLFEKHWPMGKIVEVHPGKDGLVRNVTVLTQGKTYQRAIQKIVILPVLTEESTS